MSVWFRPLRVAEFDEWVPRARDGYAQDMVENGGYEPDVAAARAEAVFAQLLADGLATAGQWLYMIEVDGVHAGELWIGEPPRDQEPSLFVYWLHVREEQRGRGLGRAAMRFAQDEARRRGIPCMALNVFAGNGPARSLYRSLGYRESAVKMTKEV